MAGYKTIEDTTIQGKKRSYRVFFGKMVKQYRVYIISIGGDSTATVAGLVSIEVARRTANELIEVFEGAGNG